MNNYWDQYYSDHMIQKASDFGLYVHKQIEHGTTILDLGCGDGRDSKYFMDKARVIAIDQSKVALQALAQRFVSIVVLPIDVCENTWVLPPIVKMVDVIYSRFFLHAINYRMQHKILDTLLWSMIPGQTLYLECRSSEGVLPDNTHLRWPVVCDTILFYLQRHGLEYDLREAYGLAKTDKEDPLIIRLEAWKKEEQQSESD